MYLYFDKKGTLLETINDEALRQYNTGVNTVNVFIEDSGDVRFLKYWFKLGNGVVLQKSEYITNKVETKSVPFDRNRDLKHFAYGKKYRFFVIDVPSGDITAVKMGTDTISYVSEGNVFSQSGLVLMTIQALYPPDSSIPALSLDKIAFSVEDAVDLPTAPVDGSEFNWLLNHYVVDNYFRPQLTYNSVIEYNGEAELMLPISNIDDEGNQYAFNRIPIVDDMFMAVYTYNGASYLGVGLVTKINTIIVEEDGEETEAISTAIVKIDSKNRVKIGSKQGEDGTTFIPSVSEDGVISWTNNGGLPNPKPIDITGPIGPQGIQGKAGTTPDITVTATVNSSTGTPSVTVTKSGTAERPTYRFSFLNLRGGIGPQGIQGTQGIGITEIVGGTPEITSSETITPITIKTSDNKQTQVEIAAKNGTTNVVAYAVTISPDAWLDSDEYVDYDYKFYAAISISPERLDYAYDTYIPTVTPTDIDDVMGDNLAPFSVSSSAGIYVYAKEKPTVEKTFNVILSHVAS